MNLSIGQAVSLRGDSGAGDGLGTVAHAGPAHPLAVGAVGFGPGWTMEDSMAASIVRLEQENDELRAEVALLREEQRILAKGFPSPAKAAVIEGVEQQDLPAGVSRIGCHERPEPSPHFNAALWKKAAVWHRAERLLLEVVNRTLQSIEQRIREERDEALWIIKQCLDCSRIMSAAKEDAK